MKFSLPKILFVFALMGVGLALSLPSQAQFTYGYGYGYGYCLKGPYCGAGYRAATIIDLSFGAINSGIYLHQQSKMHEAQVRAIHNQAENNRFMATYPQQAQSLKNIQQVSSFLDDAIPHQPSVKSSSPSVAPLKQKKIESQ